MKKTIIYTSFTMLSIFGILSYFTSCKPNPCVTRAVDCKNGGACHDGECQCAAGYEGDSCQYRVNEKYNSYFACIRTRLTNGTLVDDNDDTLRVKALNDRFSIQFYSVRDSLYEVVNATVNGNYVTIPNQTRSQGTFTASYTGSGSLNSGVLTITLFKSWNNGGPMTSKTTYVGYKYQ